MKFATVACLVVVGVSALAGCSGESEAESKPSASPSKAAAAPAVPSPDPGQTKALTGALKAIQPGLAADPEKAVSNARNVCLDLRQDKGDETAGKNAAARFGTDDSNGPKIVKAVKDSFCP